MSDGVELRRSERIHIRCRWRRYIRIGLGLAFLRWRCHRAIAQTPPFLLFVPFLLFRRPRERGIYMLFSPIQLTIPTGQTRSATPRLRASGAASASRSLCSL
jgi:hypothetical protein